MNITFDLVYHNKSLTEVTRTLPAISKGKITTVTETIGWFTVLNNTTMFQFEKDIILTLEDLATIKWLGSTL